MIALVIGACMLAAAAFLVIDRGGILAWTGAVLSALLLLKVLRWPSPKDTVLATTILGLWVIGWIATWTYVVSTWESGEVVEVEVSGGHIARVWVLDRDDGPVMYYDAPPDVASSLLAGAPVSMTRNGQISHGCATTSRVEAVPEAQIRDLLSQMEEKYKSANQATEVFYSVLGGKRDRVDVLIRLTPCP